MPIKRKAHSLNIKTLKIITPIMRIIQKYSPLFRISKHILSKFIIKPFDRIQSFGDDNPNVVYYVVGRESCQNLGLFAIVNLLLPVIEYAENNNYVPVVDLLHTSHCGYLSPAEEGLVNVWELFFAQPPTKQMGQLQTLEAAYRSKNVCLSVHNPFSSYLGGGLYHDYSRCKKDLSRNIVYDVDIQLAHLYKKYLRINDTVRDYINQQRQLLFSQNNKVLGVSLRSQYYYIHPGNHQIQPELIKFIEYVREFMGKFGYNKIFICVEDDVTIEKFKQAFGDDVVLSLNRTRIHYEIAEDSMGKYLVESYTSDITSKYENGRDYLTEVILLSSCDSLIASENSQSRIAQIFSSGYRHCKIYKLGRFGIDDQNLVDTYSLELNRWVINHI